MFQGLIFLLVVWGIAFGIAGNSAPIVWLLVDAAFGLNNHPFRVMPHAGDEASIAACINALLVVVSVALIVIVVVRLSCSPTGAGS